MDIDQNRRVAVFYCSNTRDSSEQKRRELEKLYGSSVKFYPMPCGGRIEALHLISALENFADAAFLIVCPDGACRYFEGNKRAKKRVEQAQKIISGIGLEKDRAGIIMGEKGSLKGLEDYTLEAFKQASALIPSPVHNR